MKMNSTLQKTLGAAVALGAGIGAAFALSTPSPVEGDKINAASSSVPVFTGNLPLSIIAQTPTSVTLLYPATSDCSNGYVYYVNGVKTASTASCVRLNVKFALSNCTNGNHCSVAATTRGASGDLTFTTPVTTTVTTTTQPTTTVVGAASIFISPSGNDGFCSRGGMPCASFSKAYQIAQPGDIVQIAPGSYPSQIIPTSVSRNLGTCRWAETFGDNSTTAQNTSGCVTFEGSSATVNGSLTVSAPDVFIDGLNAGSVSLGWDSDVNHPCTSFNVHDDILRNINSSIITINGANYAYIVGGSYGNSSSSSTVAGCFTGTGTPTQTSHIAIDGTSFHDVIQTNTSQHLECIHWFNGSASVITHTTFNNCAQFDLSIQPDGFSPGADVSHMLITNSTFAAPCSNQTTNNNGGLCGDNEALTTQCFGGQVAPTNVVIMNSSFQGENAPQFISNTGQACFSPTTVSNNTLAGYTAYECQVYKSQGVTFSNNVYTEQGKSC